MRIGAALSVLVWGSVLGLLGWFFHDMYEQRQEEEKLREALVQIAAEIARLDEETPCARILVHAADVNADTGKTEISMSWLDTDANWKRRPGAELKKLKVVGREAYFDSYQIIFGSENVKEGDPLRGKTLTLFARAYGSDQKPSDGTPLNMPADVLGVAEAGGELVPPAFRQGDGAPTEFEQRLWSRFWELCTDPEAAEREGVRTVQGTAVHKPLQPKMEYRLSFNNQGQIFLDGPLPPDDFVGH
jgi:hypothetical protein